VALLLQHPHQGFIYQATLRAGQSNGAIFREVSRYIAVFFVLKETQGSSEISNHKPVAF
jgi:hypothetical protein